LGLKVESELVTVWIAAFSGLRMIPMERFINVAGAQLGPIARNESRQQVVSRLLELMREAKARGSDIVVFPELGADYLFSALVDGRRRRNRQFFRTRNAQCG
jgi:predicted amidohydrolase